MDHNGTRLVSLKGKETASGMAPPNSTPFVVRRLQFANTTVVPIIFPVRFVVGTGILTYIGGRSTNCSK